APIFKNETGGIIARVICAQFGIISFLFFAGPDYRYERDENVNDHQPEKSSLQEVAGFTKIPLQDIFSPAGILLPVIAEKKIQCHVEREEVAQVDDDIVALECPDVFTLVAGTIAVNHHAIFVVWGDQDGQVTKDEAEQPACSGHFGGSARRSGCQQHNGASG